MFKRHSATLKNTESECHLPLHSAILRSDDVVIKVTPNMGATRDIVNTKDKNMDSALHLAVERGYEKWVEFLISNKADMNVLNKFGLSPLMLAVRHQHPAVVLLLLSHGANVHLKNSIGQTAIHYVCCTGDQTSLKYLLQHKAKVNVQDSEGVTPLIMACKNGQHAIVKLLLEHKTVAKANPKLCDKRGRTPLHWAAELGHAECAKILIGAKVDINASDKEYETPFVRAIKQNNLEVLDVLIEAGCDRLDIDGLNGTAMTMASLLGRSDVIKRLLKVEEDIDEFGHIGFTPLTAAVFECQVETVQMLLDSGADPNARARMGSTPLVQTISFLRQSSMSNIQKRHEITKLLLRANADTNIRCTMAGYFTLLTNGRNCPMSFSISAGCKSLAMMHLIGGCKITLSEVLEWMNRAQGSETPNNREMEVLIPLYNWVTQVRSLKYLCRKILRDHLGIMGHKKLSQLPIPAIIKRFIDYEELDSIELEFTDIDQSAKKESFMTSPSPCGLRGLQGTLSYEMLGSPAQWN